MKIRGSDGEKCECGFKMALCRQFRSQLLDRGAVNKLSVQDYFPTFLIRDFDYRPAHLHDE